MQEVGRNYHSYWKISKQKALSANLKWERKSLKLKFMIYIKWEIPSCTPTARLN